MVTIEVGLEKEHFVVHQSYLCEKSQYFAKALSGSFEEGITRFIQLPDVSPILFRIFVAWIYHDTLVYLPSNHTTIDEDFKSLEITEKDLEQTLILQSESGIKPKDEDSDIEDSDDDVTETHSGVMPNHVEHGPPSAAESLLNTLCGAAFEYKEEEPTTWPRDVLIKLYIFADRLDIRQLRADSMDSLIGTCDANHRNWGLTIVRYIYSNTASMSGLRRYIAHHTAYSHVFREDASAWDAYPPEFLAAVMVINGRRLPNQQCDHCYKKAMGYLVSSEYDDVCKQEDLAPYGRDLCFYHEHPDDTEREACRLRREGSKSAT